MDIKNSFSLQETISSTLRTVDRAISSTENSFKSLQSTLSSARNQFQTNSFFNSITTNTRNATNLVGDLGTAVNDVGNQFRGVEGFNLQNLASALYLVKNISSALSGIMEAPDQARATLSRIGLFNTSEYSNQQIYDQIARIALETRTDLQQTSDLATR